MSGGPGARVVLLGTAGGPLPSPVRSGIAQAVVVGGRVYVVDCGSGVARQLRRARLLSSLHEVLLTHLHSDHACDYFNLFLLGWPVLQWNPPVHVYGPGPAGALPPPPLDAPGGRGDLVVHAADPTPGLAELTARQIAAYAYDINVRIRESGRADLTGLLVPHEIRLPDDVDAGPQHVAPPMRPFVVAEDERVRISAVLVAHAPVFPSFAYRFDTDDGCVVFSGDTGPCENLVALADGADVLVHEVYADEPSGPRADDGGDWEARQRERHLRTAHTALSQIGSVAAAAGASRLVLTHFIPGDDVLPDVYWCDGVTGGFGGEVIVGRDLMELQL